MSTPIRNVIVAGASGNLGPHVLGALQAAHYTISALTRSNSTAQLPAYVSVTETDYSPPSLASALQSQDAVISLLPATETDTQLALVDAAAKAGVKRFVPSEFGWSPDKELLPELQARLQGKTRVMDRLQEVCRRSSMTWTAVVSGVFLDWSLKKVPSLGFILPAKKANIYDSGNEPLSGSTGADMGAAVASLLRSPEQTANRYVKIRSTQFTQYALLAAMEEVTGATWDVERIRTTDVIESRQQKVQDGRFMEAFLDTLVLQLFVDGAGRMVVDQQESDNALLGIEEKDITTVVRQLLN